jgi:hypothetical protein
MQRFALDREVLRPLDYGCAAGLLGDGSLITSKLGIEPGSFCSQCQKSSRSILSATPPVHTGKGATLPPGCDGNREVNA